MAAVCLFYVQVTAQSVGGTTSGGTSYCDSVNSGFISLTGQNGAVQFWESSTDLTVWINEGNPTPTHSYVNLTTTTHYRAIVQDGANPPDTSTISTIFVFEPAVGGIVSGGGTFCVSSGTGTLTISGETGNVIYWLVSTDGGATWTQVPNTTTTLNHPDITQNTLYTAVLENDPGCPIDTATPTAFVIDAATVAGTIASSDSVCSGNNSGILTLSGETGTILDWIFSDDNGATWNTTGTNANTYTYDDLTATLLYAAIVQNGICPAETTATVEITVIPSPTVNAGNDQTIILNETTLLQGTGTGTPVWSPTTNMTNPNALSTTVSPEQTTTYYLTVTNTTGCSSTDSVTITVEFPIPDAITPNNDGKNDFFTVDKLDILPNNRLQIYNRFGNVVYESAPYNNEWNGNGLNGQPLPDGIYYYVFDPGNGGEPFMGYVLLKR